MLEEIEALHLRARDVPVDCRDGDFQADEVDGILTKDVLEGFSSDGRIGVNESTDLGLFTIDVFAKHFDVYREAGFEVGESVNHATDLEW